MAIELLLRPRLLVLDEPTSGLDPDAEEAVLDAIARLRGRRSVIVVTHRPEPLALADVVVRVEDGKVTVEAPLIIKLGATMKIGPG